MDEYPDADSEEGKGAVIFPDKQPDDNKQQGNAKTVKEDPPVVKAGIEDGMSQQFIDDIRKDTPDYAEDDDCPGMKYLVQDEPDDQANHQMGQEEHIPV